jgi:small-conductance mechanosensitive channel
VAAAGTATAVGAASAANNGIFLGGALSGAVSKFLISPARAYQILLTVAKFAVADWKDWLLIGMCCFLPIPLARSFYFYRFRSLELDVAPMKRKFSKSKTKKVAQLVTELGELFALLFGTELVLVGLRELGFKFVNSDIHTWATSVVATIWVAKNISELKRYILYRQFKLKKRGTALVTAQKGGAKLINRMLDIVIVVATAFTILDFLSVKTGYAFQSLLGLSSIGTLVFSLASQNLASEFLASLAIQGTNMYQEGEIITMMNGNDVTTGKVEKLGWLNTHIRLGDDCIVRVPNTKIAG